MQKEMLSSKMDMVNIRGLQKYLGPNILLGLILFLGILLRFYNLGTESYWIDEIATTIEARQSIIKLLTVGRLDQPPAYNLPVHFWLRIFGDSRSELKIFLRSFRRGLNCSDLLDWATSVWKRSRIAQRLLYDDFEFPDNPLSGSPKL